MFGSRPIPYICNTTWWRPVHGGRSRNKCDHTSGQVVGGGISGMTAAIEAANTGYDVLLVEKTGNLGGMAAKLAKRVPFREPHSAPVDTGIAALIKTKNASRCR